MHHYIDWYLRSMKPTLHNTRGVSGLSIITYAFRMFSVAGSMVSAVILTSVVAIPDFEERKEES